MLAVKGAKGVNKDALPSELEPGVYSDASNVEFSGGAARQRLGVQTVYTTPTVVPYYLQTFNTSTSRFIVQAGTAKVFVDDGSTRTEITPASPFTGGRDNRWTGGDLNGVLILSNGVDVPQYWAGNTAFDLAGLTAWPAGYVPGFVRPFKNFVIAGNINKGGTKYPGLILWSDPADPGSIPAAYTSTATNQAGEQPLQDIGALVDCLQLGDTNIIYGQEGRYSMQYLGAEPFFAFTRLPGKDGLKNAGCVVQTPKGHVFLSNGDVLIHNGAEAVSIAKDRIRDWLFRTMDSSVGGRAFLTLNPQRFEVWICFPPTGSSDCNTIAAWNWVDDTWSIYSISSLTAGASGLVASALVGSTWSSDSNTWDSDVTTWDQDEYNSNEARMILATSTPTIGMANAGSTDFGSTFTYYAERTGIRPTDENAMFFVRRSQLDFDGTAGTQITVYHGMSKTADGTPAYVSGTFTQGTTDWVNAISNRGRYAAIKWTGTSGQQMALRTYRLDLRASGQE